MGAVQAYILGDGEAVQGPALGLAARKGDGLAIRLADGQCLAAHSRTPGAPCHRAGIPAGCVASSRLSGGDAERPKGA